MMFLCADSPRDQVSIGEKQGDPSDMMESAWTLSLGKVFPILRGTQWSSWLSSTSKDYITLHHISIFISWLLDIDFPCMSFHFKYLIVFRLWICIQSIPRWPWVHGINQAIYFVDEFHCCLAPLESITALVRIVLHGFSNFSTKELSMCRKMQNY